MGGGRPSKYRQRDWPRLPDELLEDLMRHFTKLKDFLSFKAVCKPWRQAATTFAQESDRPPGKFRQSLPWLMLPCNSNDSHGPNCCRFVDAAAENNNNNNVVAFRHMNVAGDEPSLYGHMSSTFGWLLRSTKQQQQQQQKHSLFLFNPFTGNQIPLPVLDDQRCNMVAFAMSADPTATTKTKRCVVMICYDSTNGPRCRALAYCTIGVDQLWRFVPIWRTAREVESQIMDIVFWKGRFHGVCKGGDVLVLCGVSGISWAFRPQVPIIENPVLYNKWCHWCCLSVSPEEEDQLMLVLRLYDLGRDRTGFYKFKVYKIDVDGNRWDEVVDIGDYAMFIDGHKVNYVPVKDHPECKRNCVYHQEGVFDIGTQKTDSYFDFIDCNSNINHQLVPYTWVLPSNY